MKYKTGLPSLDLCVDIVPGQLGLIFGACGSGKTALLRTIKAANGFDKDPSFNFLPRLDFKEDKKQLCFFDFLAIAPNACWFAPESEVGMSMSENMAVFRKYANDYQVTVLLGIPANKSPVVCDVKTIINYDNFSLRHADFAISTNRDKLIIVKNRYGPSRKEIPVEYFNSENKCLMRETYRGQESRQLLP